MPVGFARADSTRRIRFLTNVCYDGEDYGPGYPKQVADVAQNFAFELVNTKRAEFVDQGSAEAEIDENIGRAGAAPALAGSKKATSKSKAPPARKTTPPAARKTSATKSAPARKR